MRTVISLALISALWAQDDARSRVRQLAPRADVKVDVDETLSFRGRFSAAGDESITFVVGGHDHTVERRRVRRISLNRGTHHRQRNVLMGLLIGSAAGMLADISHCAGRGPACSEDPAAYFYPFAGAGALIGASVPSGDWKEIYRRVDSR